MQAARKVAPGRPWKKGQSGNPGGRGKSVATAALRAVITGDDLTAIWERAIADAKGGDVQARRDIVERLDGKAITRTESGEPGEFGLDLSDWSDEELDRAIKQLRTVK